VNSITANFILTLILLAGTRTISGDGLLAQTVQERPNIILILTDQWRGQALGIANEDKVITPRLDEIAASGVWFSEAYAARPICGPNRACIMTGQYPITHGVYGNSVRMSTASETIGTVAKANGYQTAYIGKWHLDGPDEGYVPPERRSGFDFWIMSNNHQPFNQPYYIQDSQDAVRKPGTWEPDWITDRAIEYIQSNENDPFMMVLSFGPPHTGGGVGFEDRWQPGKRDADGEIHYGYGYAAPAAYEDLYPDPEHYPRRPNVEPVGSYNDPSWQTLPGYFGAISSIDNNIGRLVDSLKKYDKFENTILFFTSDHGEMLGSQGRMTKGIWYEESLSVPAIVSYPGKIIRKEIPTVFSSIDIFPTICGLAGMEVPEEVQGTDYSSALKGNSMNFPEYAFTSFDVGSPGTNDRSWRGVHTERFSFVLAKKASYSSGDDIREEGMVLYDLSVDPYQMDPIYKGMGYDQVIDSLYAILEQHMERTGDPFIDEQWKTEKAPYYTYDNALTRDMINDIEPPSIVSNLHVADTGIQSVTLSWNASTDNIGVVAYEIYQANNYLQTTSDTFAIITGLNPGTFYAFRVLAVDAAGNKSQIAGVSVATMEETVSSSNSGANKVNAAVRIFPNPAHHSVSIIDNEANNIVNIINSQGKVLYSGYQEKIDISGLNPGLYLVRVGLHTSKLLKN
jgi:arylsulfatase A-like enzyme